MKKSKFRHGRKNTLHENPAMPAGHRRAKQWRDQQSRNRPIGLLMAMWRTPMRQRGQQTPQHRAAPGFSGPSRRARWHATEMLGWLLLLQLVARFRLVVMWQCARRCVECGSRGDGRAASQVRRRPALGGSDSGAVRAILRLVAAAVLRAVRLGRALSFTTSLLRRRVVVHDESIASPRARPARARARPAPPRRRARPARRRRCGRRARA